MFTSNVSAGVDVAGWLVVALLVFPVGVVVCTVCGLLRLVLWVYCLVLLYLIVRFGGFDCCVMDSG